MSSSRWNYVDVTCSSCNKEGRIRVDQFHRKNKIWECRSCAYTGRKNSVKNPSPKHDLEKMGAYKSYYRAKARVKQNHKGAYTNVLFLFKDFSEFWTELGPRPEGHTLDRIDVMGHYEPGNVRWATMSEQCRNKRNNIHVLYEGKKMCLYDAAKLSGMDPGALRRRIQTGCPQESLFAKGRWVAKTQRFIPSGNS